MSKQNVKYRLVEQSEGGYIFLKKREYLKGISTRCASPSTALRLPLVDIASIVFSRTEVIACKLAPPSIVTKPLTDYGGSRRSPSWLVISVCSWISSRCPTGFWRSIRFSS